MKETIIVKFVFLLKFILPFVLVFGWFPARKLEAKGGGSLLWWIYGAGILTALLLIFTGNPVIGIGNYMRDMLFTSDISLWAKIDQLFGGIGKGMRYDAGRYITELDGIRVVALAYCILTVCLWKIRLQKAIPEVNTSEATNVETKLSHPDQKDISVCPYCDEKLKEDLTGKDCPSCGGYIF